MRRPLLQLLVVTFTSVAVSSATGQRTASSAEKRDAPTVDFRTTVLPILQAKCFQCHAGQQAESGIRLDYRSKLLGEADGRALVIPGSSDSSELIRRITASDADERMPPGDEAASLSATEVEAMRGWIDAGMEWDDLAYPDPATQSPTHWAFQPLLRPPVPPVRHTSWPRNELDRFVLAEMETRDLSPSTPAERTTLIRRLSLNLTGLPPTVQEVDSFIEDPSPVAYETLVERLLASPRYGERWGRHWLDVARFAESQGYVENHPWPHIWRYRDWVVRALNEDEAYDDFMTKQVAGDEMVPYADENIVATGFLAAARLSGEELSCVRQENDMYVDMVNTTSAAFLGLTISCAQCHDHKFDPISQRDYYRLQAYFIKGYPGNLVLRQSKLPRKFADTANTLRTHTLTIRQRILTEAFGEPDYQSVRSTMLTPSDQRTPNQEATYRLTRASLNIRLAGCNGFRISDDEKKRTEELQAVLDQHRQQIHQTWGFYSPATSQHTVPVLPMASNFPLVHDAIELGRRQAFVLRRGDPYSTTLHVTPRWPTIFPSVTKPSPVPNPFARLNLANWLTSRLNPLTARVWVNRIWHYHFGRGLVATPGNFGLKGSLPTHPALLDYLACELIDSGWSTKHVQRLITSSQTYRQAGHSKAFVTKDPENLWLTRWPTRRLESEVLRDAALYLSGELDLTLGGPSVPVGETSHRRTIYYSQKRDVPSDLQSLFDAPTAMSASCERRHVSTTALQSLFLLNGVHEERLAEHFAERIRQSTGNNVEELVDRAFRVALSRPATATEIQRSIRYLDEETQRSEPKTTRGLTHGTPVSAWSPPSRRNHQVNHRAEQPVASQQPRYQDATHGINGRPTIFFRGGRPGDSDDLLEVPHSQDIDLTSTYTIFLALRFRGSSYANQVVLLKGRGGGSDIGAYSVLRYHSGDAAGRVGIDQNIDGNWKRRVFSSEVIADDVPVIIAARWDGSTVSLSIRDADGWISQDEQPLSGLIDTKGMGRLGIGGYVDAFSEHGERFNGDLGEVLIFRTALDHREMQACVDYLSHKWLIKRPERVHLGLPVTQSLGLQLTAETGVVPRTIPSLSPFGRFCQALLNLNEFVYLP